MHEHTGVVERAAEAYRALADLAETVEDEWQYVTDLVDAYLPSIQALAEPDPGLPVSAEAVAAVDEVIAEMALITDPHKAIDWLSTFPHIVALALGGNVDAAAGVQAAAAPDEADNEDSPFRMLMQGDR